MVEREIAETKDKGVRFLRKALAAIRSAKPNNLFAFGKTKLRQLKHGKTNNFIKTILFYLSLIFLIGCQAKPEFKLNFQQVLADNNNEILDYGIEKKITWTEDINGDKFTKLGHRIKFEKRWVRGKAQWIPCYFQYRSEAMSPMKFLPQAYTPAITSTYNKDYLEFTFKFLFKIGTAKQHPFTIAALYRMTFLDLIII